jgi:hypothetical protein
MRYAFMSTTRAGPSKLEQTGTGDVMASLRVATGDRIIEPMIALAGCSTQHRIVIAGSNSIEMMLDLQRRGYLRVAATANCGHPAGQYDVALVDWRGGARSTRLRRRWTGLSTSSVPARCWWCGWTLRDRPRTKVCARHSRNAVS